jgi:hypothetical protein
VERDRHEQIELELAAVVRDQLSSDAVDLPGVELRYQLDALLLEQPSKALGGDRLRERAVERRREHELDLLAKSALSEVPVGEECELERRDRTLDRHVDEVHDDPPAVEPLECAL